MSLLHYPCVSYSVEEEHKGIRVLYLSELRKAAPTRKLEYRPVDIRCGSAEWHSTDDGELMRQNNMMK